MKLLIVEDDENISGLIQTLLERNGYLCDAAFSGTEAELRLRFENYDMMICDLGLPGISGEKLIETYRKNGTMPILVLTAKESIDDKINVLGLGADDYMTKPFDNRELLARVKAQLRRSGLQKPTEKVLKWKDIELYPMEQRITVNGKEVRLTVHEFDILKLLMENPSHVYSKESLYQNVWKCGYYGEDNTVSVHMSNIRKKLATCSQEEYIETVWGIGFKLKK